MKLSGKMLSLVMLQISIMVILVVLGFVNINHMEKSLTGIAKDEVPLSIVISKITATQLEQLAWLERGVLAVETENNDSLDVSIREFERLTNVVKDGLFKNNAWVKLHSGKGLDDSVQQRYGKQLDQFSTIETDYMDFVKEAGQLQTLLQKGLSAEAVQRLPEIEVMADNISKALQSFIAAVGESTKLVAVNAEEVSRTTYQIMGVISAITIVLSLFFGFKIVNSINRQLGSDPALLEQIAEALADGKLRTDLDKNALGVYGSITKMVEKIIDVITGIKIRADEVRQAAEQVSIGNTDLSQRTQEQASSLEEVASSMEQMTGTVNQNAENAQQANQLARAAREQAEKGGDVVGRTVTAMNEINSSSKKIEDIIVVIDEIAFQTNLLALNAAVEAARAGEQGRGFAVVASEVRNLAGRSATAAKEIKALIKDSVIKVEGGTKLVDESGQMLEEIVTSVKKVSDIVAEIAAASQEQSEGIEQVNKAVLQMDDMTQHNASLVEEAAAASAGVGAQAQELMTLVDFFDLNETDKNMNREYPVSVADPGDSPPENRTSVTQAQRAKTLPGPQKKDDSDWEEF